MSKDINCPYCGFEQDINHDDGYGYREDVKHQQECYKCGKTFIFTTSISFYYDAEIADCLNGGDHNFKYTHTYPVECTKMRCSMCDEERDCTKEEMENLLKLRKTFKQ